MQKQIDIVVNVDKSGSGKRDIKQLEKETRSMVHNLGEDFDGVNVTVKDLVERLADLKDRFKDSVIGSEAYNRFGREIQEVSGHLSSLQGQLQGTTKELNLSTARSGAFRMGLTQSTQALSMLNPQLGAFSQTLNPLIYGLDRVAVKTQGWKTALSSVLTSFGPAIGIGLAITGVTMLISKYKDQQTKLNEEIEKSKKVIDEYKNSLIGLSSLRLGTERETIQSQITAIEDAALIRTQSIMQNGSGLSFDQIYQQVLAFDKARLDALKQRLLLIKDEGNSLGFITDTQRKINELTIEQNSLSGEQRQRSHEITKEIERLNNEMNGFLGKNKEVKTVFTEITKEVGKWHEEIRKAERPLNQLIIKLGKILNPPQSVLSGGKMGTIDVPKPMLAFQQELANLRDDEMVLQGLKNQFKELNIIAEESANLIGSAFKGVWEEVFGEANSLFEQFIQNMIMRLAELQMQKLSNTIFSFLLNSVLPGAGMAAGAIGGSNQPININIDGQQVASAMIPYQRNMLRASSRI